MPVYSVKHTCGHIRTHHIEGPKKQREQKVWHYEMSKCHECWTKPLADAAQAKTEPLLLPELIGSKKQVAWALCERLTTGSRFHEAIAEVFNDIATVRSILLNCYPGQATLFACDVLDENRPDKADLVLRIREAVEWFADCDRATDWIDSRKSRDDLESILEFIEEVREPAQHNTYA
jgi:hypothetical protein